jgi:outer membrane lipoprotein-sorting protein
LRIFIVVLILASILSRSQLLAKENENLDTVLNQIQEKYEKINDFSSKFTQEGTESTRRRVV